MGKLGVEFLVNLIAGIVIRVGWTFSKLDQAMEWVSTAYRVGYDMARKENDEVR